MQIRHIYAKIHRFTVKQLGVLAPGNGFRQGLKELEHFKNQIFPTIALVSAPLCSKTEGWGDISMTFCIHVYLKTAVPSPGVPGSLSLNSGQENFPTELTDIFAL